MQTRFSGHYDEDYSEFIEILVWTIVLMVVIVLGCIGTGVIK
jgi:hypothetical protein